jgi:hypothetical protein
MLLPRKSSARPEGCRLPPYAAIAPGGYDRRREVEPFAASVTVSNAGHIFSDTLTG